MDNLKENLTFSFESITPVSGSPKMVEIYSVLEVWELDNPETTLSAQFDPETWTYKFTYRFSGDYAPVYKTSREVAGADSEIFESISFYKVGQRIGTKTVCHFEDLETTLKSLAEAYDELDCVISRFFGDCNEYYLNCLEEQELRAQAITTAKNTWGIA